MDIRLKKIVDSDLETVLRWRTSPDITKWMFTDITYDMEKQRQWFDGLQNDNSQKFWVVKIDDKPVGSFFLKGIDRDKGEAEIGYYFPPSEYSTLTAMVPAAFYWWGFNNGFNEYSLMIFYDHNRLINLHLLHGFQLANVLPDYAKRKTVFKMAMRKSDYRGARILPAEVEV